jgi:8-amino-7-oxononanoate synthase
MIADRYASYKKTLSRLETRHRQRTLTQASGIDFASNDYLALANACRIRQAITTAIESGIAIGAGGSRLLRGNHEIFETLEAAAATFFKSEKTLFFGSGYAANFALFSTLPQRGDCIFYDEYVHASIHDGIAASRAQAVAVRHNNAENFKFAIQQWRKTGGTGRPWVAVDSLYSMDGDRAPLNELFTLANEHDGFLVIDEAHATGVFGQQGRGLASFFDGQDNVIILHTCGKALGVAGALLCLNNVFYHYLINRARTFIYSTAPSPLIAVGVCEALNILRDEPHRLNKLKTLYTYANKQMHMICGLMGSGTQIIPVLIGKNHLAVKVAIRLQTAGFDIRAIRSPTVPEGTARLRISITLHVSENEIDQMLIQLFIIMKEAML